MPTARRTRQTLFKRHCDLRFHIPSHASQGDETDEMDPAEWPPTLVNLVPRRSLQSRASVLVTKIGGLWFPSESLLSSKSVTTPMP
jgi:hypothetical protein